MFIYDVIERLREGSQVLLEGQFVCRFKRLFEAQSAAYRFSVGGRYRAERLRQIVAQPFFAYFGGKLRRRTF